MAVVVVLGGHRCGTSSVAGVIDRLGIPTALPGCAIGPSASNPRGHFEDAILCRFHERLLGRGGWRNPVPTATVSPRIVDAYDAHLCRRAAADRWCVKDPRLCFVLPFLLDRLRVLESVCRVVTVIRTPAAAAASLRRRQRMSPDAAERIAWLYEGARRGQVAGLQLSERTSLLTVSYDELVDNPAAEASRLAEFLGVSVTTEAVEFLEPALRHW